MSKIVSKLNLNKTPQLVENNSLIMAKNIRLLEDGTIGPDTSLKEIETNTGYSTTHIIHHPAVTKTKIVYNYTILNYEATIKASNGLPISDAELNNSAYDFSNYHPIDKITILLKPYLKVEENVPCTVYCYSHSATNKQPTWITSQFRYNATDNILVNSNGYALLLAVLQGSGDNGDSRTALNLYYYMSLPKTSIGKGILINGNTYILYNPVYKTTTTETITITEAYDEIIESFDTLKYVGQIVGFNNKVYIFRESNAVTYTEEAQVLIEQKYANEGFAASRNVQREITFTKDNNGYVLRNGEIFEDRNIAVQLTPELNNRVKIYELDEVTDKVKLIPSAWKYSGGEITGCVSVNNVGDTILTIGEYNVPDNKLVPIKHININTCKTTDNESIYTQAPNIPITNLSFNDYYTEQIPSGVYQFFVRYQIREDFYTNWFPCSKELSTGYKTQINTIQGSIMHTDLHIDSNLSFVFDVEHLIDKNKSNFEKFQLGFILSHEDGVYARIWKKFDFSTETIKFDYHKEDIEEGNIDDFLKVNYDIYNVGNIVNFKNKIYISNFEESDFNDNNIALTEFAQNIEISEKTDDVSYGKEYRLNSCKCNVLMDTNVPFKKLWFDKCTSNIGEELSFTDLYGDEGWCNVNSPQPTSTPNYGIKPIEQYLSYMRTACDKGNLILISLKVGNTAIIDNYSTIIDNGNMSDYENYLLDATDITKSIIKQIVKQYGEIYYVGLWGAAYANIYGAVNSGISGDELTVLSESISYAYIQITYVPMNANNPENDYIKYTETKGTVTVTSTYNYSSKSTTKITPNQQTLIPFTDYTFYCHFVKENGLITNGYKIKDLKTSFNTSNRDITKDIIIYPTFKPKKSIPDGYVAYFVSMIKHQKTTCQLFGVKKQGTSDNGDGNIYMAHCLEYDCLLQTVLENIKIYKSDKTLVSSNGAYASSSFIGGSDGSDFSYFGDVGVIYFGSSQSDLKDTTLWIVGNDIKTNNRSLIKITPYINNTNLYDDKDQLFLDGYYCEVSKLKHQKEYGSDNSSDEEQQYYINGQDVYKYCGSTSASKNTQQDSSTDISYRSKLKLYEGYIPTQYSNPVYIHSNYNLNYVSLSQDISPKLRNTYNNDDGSSNPTKETQIIHSVDSSIASYILTLTKDFRDYTRKLFYIKDNNKITKYNNVIRCSDTLVDEKQAYIRKFNAVDYYNVPTTRGIITNLIAIANSVYVHCEHSLFKFTDNKSLNTQDEEVSLQETDIFNSGISEVFDAQYGYAGLKKKEQSLITFNAYIFYDEVSKIIYAFGGEQQIGNLSQSIQKLIDFVNPTDVRFLGDENHNRFFVNLLSNTGNVCLSFNFTAKSFVSIHDFNFNFGFHTRRHTYLIHDIVYDNSVIGWSIYKLIDCIKTYNVVDNRALQTETKNYTAYQGCYEQSIIHIPDCDDDIIHNELNCVNSCVDVIINEEYEKIKVLNTINWICSRIRSYGNNLNFVAEESLDRSYPADKIRIYSDITSTDLIKLLDSNDNPKISNNESISDPTSWQYPRFNCGIWSMNYFRDINNIYDIFDYKNPNNNLIGNEGDSETTNLIPKQNRQNYTQENSLIYGKYFVIRFIFNNNNFKLENVFIKTNDYVKTN